MAACRWRVVDSFRDCAIAPQLSKTSGCGHKFLRCSTRLFTFQPHDAESPPAKHGPLPSFSPPLHQSRIATLQLLAAGGGGRLKGGKSFWACDGGACDALRMETRLHCDGIPSERVGLIPRKRNTRASGARDELPDPKPPSLQDSMRQIWPRLMMIASTATSAGFTPGIRAACARFSGRYFLSCCRLSNRTASHAS